MTLPDTNFSANALSSDVLKTISWACHWKMSFKLGRLKQAQVTFFLKIKKSSQGMLIFNNNQVNKNPIAKHFGLFLAEKIHFGEDLRYISKVNKSIELLRKLQNILPRWSLATIYKSFIRPHYDFGGIISDQVYNISLHENIKYFLCNWAITSISNEKSRFKKTNNNNKNKTRIIFRISQYIHTVVGLVTSVFNRDVIFMSYSFFKPPLINQLCVETWFFLL